ncbi:hypothetical protein TNCV_2115301 [Trichonephila clavipes]|nr:hypothetical protein TNCV_2115301 [Trichonephila clavipes]
MTSQVKNSSGVKFSPNPPSLKCSIQKDGNITVERHPFETENLVEFVNQQSFPAYEDKRVPQLSIMLFVCIPNHAVNLGVSLSYSHSWW